MFFFSREYRKRKETNGWKIKNATGLFLVQIHPSRFVSKIICPVPRAPAKRPHYINTTYRNIVGPAFASFGQTITTFEQNISQNCWGQHVARVWPPCCELKMELVCMLRRNIVGRPGQMTTTSCNIHKCRMKNLTIFKFEPTTPNMSQYIATTMLRFVALKCCNRLARG